MRDLVRLRERLSQDAGSDPVAVAEVMRTDFITVRPSMRLSDAMRAIVRADTGCLLVAEEGRLLGIVTDRDLVVAASRLLDEP